MTLEIRFVDSLAAELGRSASRYAAIMHRFAIVFLLVTQALVTASPTGAQAADSAQVDLLDHLYKAFSWEATGGDNGPGRRTFVDQPRAVLDRYLDSELTELMLRDRTCVRKSSAICRLDFAPLWDSQDPDAVDISFTAAPGHPNTVIAHLRDSRGIETAITYLFRRTRAGWRIADIQYARGYSLRALLGGRSSGVP